MFCPSYEENVEKFETSWRSDRDLTQYKMCKWLNLSNDQHIFVLFFNENLRS